MTNIKDKKLLSRSLLLSVNEAVMFSFLESIRLRNKRLKTRVQKLLLFLFYFVFFLADYLKNKHKLFSMLSALVAESRGCETGNSTS